MSRKCELTGKGPMTGHTVSHSNIKTKRRFSAEPVQRHDDFRSARPLGRSCASRRMRSARSITAAASMLSSLKAKDVELSPRARSTSRREVAKKRAARRRSDSSLPAALTPAIHRQIIDYADARDQLSHAVTKPFLSTPTSANCSRMRPLQHARSYRPTSASNEWPWPSLATCTPSASILSISIAQVGLEDQRHRRPTAPGRMVCAQITRRMRGSQRRWHQVTVALKHHEIIAARQERARQKYHSYRCCASCLNSPGCLARR